MKRHHKKLLIVPSDLNLWFDQITNQITEIQIKSKSNQRFPDQIFLLKSNRHTWFNRDKSNHDLILLITEINASH